MNFMRSLHKTITSANLNANSLRFTLGFPSSNPCILGVNRLVVSGACKVH